MLEQINPEFFLKEFSFAKNNFRDTGVGEKEVSDHLVLLGPITLQFEEKSRATNGPTSADAEREWFKKKNHRYRYRSAFENAEIP